MQCERIVARAERLKASPEPDKKAMHISLKTDFMTSKMLRRQFWMKSVTI